MFESFDTETLAGLVLAHVDADPTSLRFTPIRTGKHNTSYWVESDRAASCCGLPRLTTQAFCSTSA